MGLPRDCNIQTGEMGNWWRKDHLATGRQEREIRDLGPRLPQKAKPLQNVTSFRVRGWWTLVDDCAHRQSAYVTTGETDIKVWGSRATARSG